MGDIKVFVLAGSDLSASLIRALCGSGQSIDAVVVLGNARFDCRFNVPNADLLMCEFLGKRLILQGEDLKKIEHAEFPIFPIKIDQLPESLPEIKTKKKKEKSFLRTKKWEHGKKRQKINPKGQFCNRIKW